MSAAPLVIHKYSKGCSTNGCEEHVASSSVGVVLLLLLLIAKRYCGSIEGYAKPIQRLNLPKDSE